MENSQDLSVPVIAIDGGEATGKGTVRHLVAEQTGFHELDSGLLYRAVGMRGGLVSDVSQLVQIASSLNLKISGKDIFLDDIKVTYDIRSGATGLLAARVAKIPEVREVLQGFQLGMRKLPGLVADGRDQCSVFETPHRFFLMVDSIVGATRRMKEFHSRGDMIDHGSVLRDLIRRDEEDRNRPVSPLRKHPEAQVVDTSRLTAQQVAEIILTEYNK